MKTQFSYYSGTSNLVTPLKQSEYPIEFKGASRLNYYASLFSSVEINASFYKLPQKTTIEKWGKSVPDNFRFTFKVSKSITHAKDLLFSSKELELFIETVDRIGDKKGCLLVQLPPKLSREKEEELAGLLECLHDNTIGWNIAVEFRHPSWYHREIYRLLEGYGIGMVHHDMPRAITPNIKISESFEYIRFHGLEGTYRGSYEDAVLYQYAKQIANWLKGGKEVYVYFNNTIGNAIGNLQTLNKMVNDLFK